MAHTASIAALLALAGSSALAAPEPRLVPARDVTVDYQVSPPDHEPISVQVAVAAGGMRLHIVGQDLPTTFLVDRQTESAAIIVPMLRTYARIGIGRYDPSHTVLRGAEFSRAGHGKVAGLDCIQWTARSADGAAQACVTPDGVILSGGAHSNRKGDLGAIRAVRVRYGALPAALFEVPADFTESPLGQAVAQFLK